MGNPKEKFFTKEWKNCSNLLLQSLKWSILCFKKEKNQGEKRRVLCCKKSFKTPVCWKMLYSSIYFTFTTMYPYVHSHWLHCCSFNTTSQRTSLCTHITDMGHCVVLSSSSYHPTNFHFYCHHICCYKQMFPCAQAVCFKAELDLVINTSTTYMVISSRDESMEPNWRQ